MPVDPDEDNHDIETVKTLLMTYPNQHEHNPDLEDDDELDQQLKAVQVGPRQWRILESPVFSEAVGYGDTVEGDFDEDGSFVIERIVEKSKFRTIRTMVPRMFFFSDFGKGFLDRVTESGGMWELVFWGILILNLPEGKADELEELFRVACEEASVFGEGETRRPAELHREHPNGCCVRNDDGN